jgi:hypothetical protein
MSVNATMNALANIFKPEGGPMDIETAQKTEEEKEEEKKAYEARIEAAHVPTPDELANRVCLQLSASVYSRCKALTWTAFSVKAMEVTSRMTDFNCDFHPDERAKFEMRQVAHKLFNSLVLSLPEKIDPEDSVWKRKAREFWIACEEMDKWLGENEDDEDYTDDEDMPPAWLNFVSMRLVCYSDRTTQGIVYSRPDI